MIAKQIDEWNLYASFTHDTAGYDEPDLYRVTGVHGAYNWAGIVSLIVASVIGL